MATELHHWEFTILPNCSSCFATDNNRKLALPAGTWPVKLNVLIVLAGTISVTIATMAKTDTNHTSEVYVVGFVPTYVLPKKRAIPLDPFLAPLCAEIIDGFIQGEVEIVPLNKNKAVTVAVLDSLSLNVIITVGIDVEYSLSLPGLPSGPAKLRHLLLLWTGDHVAQCEISKGIFCGQRPCRFCKVEGTVSQPVSGQL